MVLIREKHKRKSFLVNKIQSTLIGWYFRLKFFSSVKKLLISEQNELYDKLIKKFDDKLLYNLDKYNKLTYDSNGWKKFYTDSEYNFKNLIFESSLFTKIFVGIDNNDKLFFYTGYLNRYNIKNGQGNLYFEDSKQQGCWLDDKLIGWCRIINNDGYLIEGLFQNGLLNGKGEIIGNERKYHFVGEFKNGIKNGLGKEVTWEHIYEGFFVNNKKHGKGKLIFKTSFDTYEGNFIENQLTGIGFYTWANKDTYKGTFVNGKMDGEGIYRWKNGKTYEGQYLDGIKEGYGVIRENNQIVFEGEFKNGVPDGQGFVIKNGKKVKITMENGKMKMSTDSQENKDIKGKIVYNFSN